MEDQLLEIAFSNVLEELKEVKQEQQKATVTAPAVDLTPVTVTIMQGLDNINNTIEAQPKSITKQFRILLFPEDGAREYYGLVFGRLLMWIFFIFIACFLFALSKEYIEVNATVKQAESPNVNTIKTGRHVYKKIKKARKGKIDSINIKTIK